jgi:hypothetical protein
LEQPESGNAGVRLPFMESGNAGLRLPFSRDGRGPIGVGLRLVERPACVAQNARHSGHRGLTPGMLSGFNTNIRYRGVLFHVQSEDSGRDHPHIITHLYHGGTILFSEKSSYADRVADADLAGVVRGLMESQHKAVLKRLRSGEFDAAIRERLGEVFGEADPADGKAAMRPSDTDPLEEAKPPPSQTESLTEPPVEDPESSRPFGQGIVSERPLDDVILGYLLENARKRRSKSAS